MHTNPAVEQDKNIKLGVREFSPVGEEKVNGEKHLPKSQVLIQIKRLNE